MNNQGQNTIVELFDQVANPSRVRSHEEISFEDDITRRTRELEEPPIRSSSPAPSHRGYQHRPDPEPRERSRSRSRSRDRESMQSIKSVNSVHSVKKSNEEMEAEKMAMYQELMTTYRSTLTHKITPNTPYHVMKAELNIQRKMKDEDQKVFIMKLILSLGLRGVEWGTSYVKFFKLKGWAKFACQDMQRYDPVLRRIYADLFPQGAGSNPYWELAIMLGVSAITYQFSAQLQQKFQNPQISDGLPTVPSGANPFMDRNVTPPTPPQQPSQPSQPSQPGNGLFDMLGSVLGGSGGSNPLSSIMGMMQNGSLGNFMNQVQQEPNPSSFPPPDMTGPASPPLTQHSTPPPSQPSFQPPHPNPPPPQPQQQPQNTRARPPPPFNERTSEFEHNQQPKRDAEIEYASMSTIADSDSDGD